MEIRYKTLETGSLVGARDDKVVLAYKPQSVTPYQLMLQIKEALRQAQGKIGYAGRLDPMAEGLMIFLVGEENKKRKEYERMDKTYVFEVLFGVQTDSYDVLGLDIPGIMLRTTRAGMQNKINKYLERLVGEFRQEYPPYSAPLVGGKPLFKWAREGKIDQIKLPSKKVGVETAKLLSLTTISSRDLQENIYKRINALDGDFRQVEVLKGWDEFFEKNPNKKFDVAKIEIHSSSGIYVRSIANDLGKFVGSGAIALNIVRTRVGEYPISILET